MGVIPVCANLRGYSELVQEGIPWRDRALGNKCRSVSPSCSVLEDAMPVLRHRGEQTVRIKAHYTHYACTFYHSIIGQLVYNIELEMRSLNSCQVSVTSL